jgi:hypothetical protein
MLGRGQPRHGEKLKRNSGMSLTGEVLDAINELPQIQSGEWTKSYLAEQLWRNYLGLPTGYNTVDLELIAQGKIIV